MDIVGKKVLPAMDIISDQTLVSLRWPIVQGHSKKQGTDPQPIWCSDSLLIGGSGHRAE